jgi:hypothetical protein
MFLRNSRCLCRLLYFVTLAVCVALIDSQARAQFETRATTALPEGPTVSPSEILTTMASPTWL